MKLGNGLIGLGLLLIAAALCLTGYHIWDDSRAALSAEAALEEILPQIPAYHAEAESTDPEEAMLPDIQTGIALANPKRELPQVEAEEISYVGILRIPGKEKEWPVIAEWSYPHLQIAPCLYSGTPYKENMILCAHNYRSHFGVLRDLSLGDEVSFTDTEGNCFVYHVMEIETLEPTDFSGMKSGEWKLTLFTCTIGGEKRIAVRCE